MTNILFHVLLTGSDGGLAHLEAHLGSRVVDEAAERRLAVVVGGVAILLLLGVLLLLLLCHGRRRRAQLWDSRDMLRNRMVEGRRLSRAHVGVGTALHGQARCVRSLSRWSGETRLLVRLDRVATQRMPAANASSNRTRSSPQLASILALSPPGSRSRNEQV